MTITDFIKLTVNDFRNNGAEVLESHTEGNKGYIIYKHNTLYHIVIFKDNKRHEKICESATEYLNSGLDWLVENF